MNLSSLSDVIKEKQKTLFVLCGFPYSGKTTAAKRLAEITGATHIAIDDFFYEHGYDWDSNKLPNKEGWNQIFADSFTVTKDALSENKNVLYDSTNQTRESRDKLRNIAKAVDAETVVIFFDVPQEMVWERWENNKKNRERSVVSKELVQMTLDAFETPTEDESVYRIVSK